MLQASIAQGEALPYHMGSIQPAFREVVFHTRVNQAFLMTLAHIVTNKWPLAILRLESVSVPETTELMPVVPLAPSNFDLSYTHAFEKA